MHNVRVAPERIACRLLSRPRSATEFTFSGRVAHGKRFTTFIMPTLILPSRSRDTTMKILLTVGLWLIVTTSGFAQVVNYHMGTILGNGSPQGYHVGTVGIGNFNDRLSLRAATFTPWEFGELWVGPDVQWIIPKSQKFQADLLFTIAIVGRFDGNFQPLKNLRPALSFGVGF